MPGLDDIFADLQERRLVLTFLQELHGGMWQAAVRRGGQDFERGYAATAVAALLQAIAHADEERVVPFKEIWMAGRSAETRPIAAPPAPPAPPAPVDEDIFG